jgi:hypothetical protein
MCGSTPRDSFDIVWIGKLPGTTVNAFLAAFALLQHSASWLLLCVFLSDCPSTASNEQQMWFE